MTNLATNLVTTAEQHPDNTMIAMGGKHLSYAVMHQLAAKLAGDLKASGIEPGDRVALILPNVPAFPVAFFATLYAGGTVVPMNPLLKAGEIDFFFTNSGAKIAFVWPDFVDEVTKGAANSGILVVPCDPMGPVGDLLTAGEPITARAPCTAASRSPRPWSAPMTTRRSFCIRRARPAGLRAPS